MEHIPAELIAKARAFRKRVVEADDAWRAMDDALHVELLQRLRNGKLSYRPENGIDLARRRRDAAAMQFGQRPFAYWQGSRKLFRLYEARLTTAKSREAAWDEDSLEDTVNLVEIITTLDYRDTTGNLYKQDVRTLAAFGHHALVRYFQRAFHPSDDALADAFWVLLKTKLERTDRGVAIPVEAAGGHWFGRCMPVFDLELGQTQDQIDHALRTTKANHCFSVRTFYSADGT